jgi:hypothetical protein
MSSSETTAMGFAIGMGIVAVLAGFFGLRTQYRRHRASRQTAAPISPPARRIPPVDAKPQTERTPAQPEYQTELPAHKLDPELPAHTTENKPKTPPDAPTSTP